MTDTAKLMREAAERLNLTAERESDFGLASRLEAAAAEVESAEPVAWVSDELIKGKCVGVMAYRERNSDDQVPLYLAPKPAVPEVRDE